MRQSVRCSYCHACECIGHRTLALPFKAVTADVGRRLPGRLVLRWGVPVRVNEPSNSLQIAKFGKGGNPAVWRQLVDDPRKDFRQLLRELVL
jgi:hypothetical protein